MANISITRDTKANIDAMPITDGRMYFTTDQTYNHIYTDNGTNRIQIGGQQTVDTSLSTTSTNPIANNVVSTEINKINTDFTAKLQNKFDAFGSNYKGNLDSLVSNGCYFITTTTGISGTLPTGFSYFTLLVFRSEYADVNSCVQLAVNTTGKAMASRMYINNVWTAWGVYNSVT